MMDPNLLYESPFTDFHTKGVDGVFPPDDVVRLVEALHDVDKRSAA